MTIGTYSELQTAVAGLLHRDDLTDEIKTFISVLEGQLSADIYGRSMESRTSLTCTANNAFVTLPTDVIEIRRIYNTTTTPQRALTFVAPDELIKKHPYGETGEPAIYCTIGGQLQLAPIPDSAYVLECAYLQSVPALSDSNTTNWVLTKYPNVYLYGTLFHLCNHLRDFDGAKVWQGFYQQGVKAANSIDWHTGGVMTVRAA